MINKIEIAGNWNERKGKLKQKFASLIANETLYADGELDELLGRLQKKIGKRKEELRKIINTY